MKLFQMIDVSKLGKLYIKTVLLDRVSFQVSKGEFFAFLGPNDAGKTISIRIFNGLTVRSGGTVGFVVICGNKAKG